MCSKSEQKFNLMTKLQLPNLHQTVFNTCISINISNSNNLKKLRVGIFACHGHIKFTKQQLVSQSVSNKGIQMMGLGSDKNVSWLMITIVLVLYHNHHSIWISLMMTTRCNLFYDDHCAGLVLKWFWSPMQQSGDPLFGFQWNHTHNTLKDDEKKVFNFP